MENEKQMCEEKEEKGTSTTSKPSQPKIVKYVRLKYEIVNGWEQTLRRKIDLSSAMCWYKKLSQLPQNQIYSR